MCAGGITLVVFDYSRLHQLVRWREHDFIAGASASCAGCNFYQNSKKVSIYI
jgi:hypothetical protein